MGSFENYIRGIVQNHRELKNKLKKGASKQTPFQYVYQTLTLTGLSSGAMFFLIFMITKSNYLYLVLGFVFGFFLVPFIYNFFLSRFLNKIL